MWEFHEMIIKTHVGRLKSMKKNRWVKNRFFKKKISIYVGKFLYFREQFFHDFPPKFGDLLEYIDFIGPIFAHNFLILWWWWWLVIGGGWCREIILSNPITIKFKHVSI